jgi:hypothetical protein
MAISIGIVIGIGVVIGIAMWIGYELYEAPIMDDGGNIIDISESDNDGDIKDDINNEDEL